MEGSYKAKVKTQRRIVSMVILMSKAKKNLQTQIMLSAIYNSKRINVWTSQRFAISFQFYLRFPLYFGFFSATF